MHCAYFVNTGTFFLHVLFYNMNTGYLMSFGFATCNSFRMQNIIAVSQLVYAMCVCVCLHVTTSVCGVSMWSRVHVCVCVCVQH